MWRTIRKIWAAPGKVMPSAEAAYRSRSSVRPWPRDRAPGPGGGRGGQPVLDRGQQAGLVRLDGHHVAGTALVEQGGGGVLGVQRVQGEGHRGGVVSGRTQVLHKCCHHEDFVGLAGDLALGQHDRAVRATISSSTVGEQPQAGQGGQPEGVSPGQQVGRRNARGDSGAVSRSSRSRTRRADRRRRSNRCSSTSSPRWQDARGRSLVLRSHSRSPRPSL